MEKELHILILEDLPSDAELAEREVRTVLDNYIVKVLDTRDEMIEALDTFKPDLIISDYLMPEFDGLSALKIRQEQCPYVPFVMLTGSVNEEIAVECMKAGADDYVIKEHIKRLGSAVLGAMEKKKREKEQKKAEEELIRLSTAVKQSPSVIAITDLKGNLEYMNPKFSEVTGYSFEEAKGQHTRILRSREMPDEHYKDLWKTITAGKEWRGEFHNKKKNGDLFWEAASISPIFNQEKKIINYIKVAEDITVRKEIEEALQNSEILQRTVLNSLHDALHLVDTELRVKLYNDKVSDWFTQLGLGEMTLGGSLQDLCPFLNEDDIEQYRQVLETGEVIFTEEENDFNGRVIITETRKIPLIAGKKVTGVITIVSDITERKRAEKELKSTLQQLEILKNKIEIENVYLQEEIKLQHNFSEIIGESKVMLKMFKQIELVSTTDSTVLILGETGSGKELVARAIHNLSRRNKHPLVKVNCPAMPSELIESELFGHVRGAFTGAVDKKIGRFELADKGTIFLDEIGDLPLGLQVKLLRVLQEGEFERVGSSITQKVDVRVIAATNRDLDQLVLDGDFRQDLYFRLKVFPITSPGLKERIEDIPLLTNHFVKKFNPKMGKNVSVIPQVLIDKLQDYNWPGNVRELENVIERAMIFNQNDTLEIGDWFDMDSPSTGKYSGRTLSENESEYILTILEETKWRIRGINGAAEILGMKPTTLESRMKKLNICRPGYNDYI